MSGLLIAEAVSTASVFTAEQTTSINNALTSTVNAFVSTFVDLLPIIALTTGAIFGIRFIKKRFNKIERQG